MRKNRNIKLEDMPEQRSAILAALAKAGGEAAAADGSAVDLDEGKSAYYVLKREEVAALVNGNMDKIEGWVSNLDRRHATLLLRWLIKESG